MADNYIRPYIDSSVWIAWIKGEIINGIDRKQVFEHILYQAENGAFSIYTSTATLAEVHKKKGSDALTDNEDDEILSFFEKDYIVLIDVDREIGEQANRFCRDKNLSQTGATLKPFDAIHLACCLRAKCDYLLTWDSNIVSCVHPDVKIENPIMRGQMRMPLTNP